MRSDPSDTQSHWLVAFGRLLIVTLFFTISVDVLIVNGFQYDEPGGTPLDKLHPGTWIALFVFAILVAERGNPFTGLVEIIDDHIQLLPYLLGVLFMIGYVTLVIHAPFTIFLETFLAPLILLLLFERISMREGRRLAWLIHLLILVNALLGIYEVAFSYRLTPYMIQGEPMLTDWRATALLGHPLANAAIMGSYVFILALGGHRDLPGWLAALLGAIAATSLFAFGGRAATGLVLAGLVIIAVMRIAGILGGRTFSLSGVMAAMLTTPLFIVAAYAMWSTGFFDLFLDRIADDSGSASTRVEMFELFEHLKWDDLILVPDKKHIATWVSILGLDYGIENFVVSFVLSYGIVATILFLYTLLSFCREVTRMLRPKTGWVFVYFFAVALTSVSLSAKSPLLSLLIIMLAVLMRKQTESAMNSRVRLVQGVRRTHHMAYDS